MSGVFTTKAVISYLHLNLAAEIPIYVVIECDSTRNQDFNCLLGVFFFPFLLFPFLLFPFLLFPFLLFPFLLFPFLLFPFLFFPFLLFSSSFSSSSSSSFSFISLRYCMHMVHRHAL
ncbi:hypothetical protein STEG23_017932, partial [Scotinomys teguina]